MAEMPSAASGWQPVPWDDGDDQDVQNFVVESGTPSFARSLTRRQKMLRGGIALLVVVATAFFLLGGPGATASLVESLHQRVAVAAPIPLARVEQLAAVRLPPGSATIATLRVSPAAGGIGAAYACWVSPRAVVNDVEVGRLHVAALGGAAQSWRDVTPPVASAVRCAITADSVSPRTAILSVYTHTGSGAACTLPTLYLTADGGGTWQPVAWPDANTRACSVGLGLAQDTIYATSSEPLVPAAGRPAGTGGHVIVSEDAGRSWHVADTTPGAAAGFALLDIGFALLDIRPGGRLLAEATDASKRNAVALWESRDDGRSWRSLGDLPGADPQVYVSLDPAETGDGGWGRLYLSAHNAAGQPFFATATAGSGWRTLPALPLASADDGVEGGDFTSAGVGPDGLLFVTRTLVGSNAHTFTPQRAIWIWEPRHGAWLFSPVGLPPNTLEQGVSWSRQGMTLWMTIIHQGIPPTVQIATLTVPAQR